MKRRLSTSILLLAFLSAAAFAQAEPAAESAVAATVGDDTIEVAEVQRAMEAIFPNLKPTGDLLPMAQAQVLEGLVSRRLVLAYARRTDDLPSEEELAKAKKRLQVRLAAQDRRASDGGKSESVGAACIERQAFWELVWDRYLAKYCTPHRREAWFEKHHRDVDGTELVVSYILLRPTNGGSAKEMDALEQRAEAIRAEILSGTIDFAAAAEKYSAGASRRQGGRLGKIGRLGPQDESFSRAAFALQAGEISRPVRSPFGVHLIRCDQVVPGTKTLSELAGPVDMALAKELLEKLSRLERRQTPVKYTSAWPHFKEGTQELEK